MQRIFVVIGTRPEAIKMAPIVRALREDPERFEALICLTGQHREMVEQVMRVFDLHADLDLAVMQPGQTLAALTARTIAALEQSLIQAKPDLVLVQGDTTSAFCGALAAFYQRVPVGHVEAGLRTGDKQRPFPEEVNRAMITRIADWHFVPTRTSRDALLAEGVPLADIHLTGNTVVDALLWTRDQVRSRPPVLPPGVRPTTDGEQIVLVTGHRRESFGEGLRQISAAIREVADARSDVRFIFPVHLNPQVREPVFRILGDHPRIQLIEPQGYQAFVYLMDMATVILTDSGGVQEEAPSLGKPVLVMRETTERPEGVDAGNAVLVGANRQKIVEHLTRLLARADLRDAMAAGDNPYGDGRAAERIVSILAAGRSPSETTAEQNFPQNTHPARGLDDG